MELFKIDKNCEFGRFVVATTNIKAGQLLFEEYPFAYGPKGNSKCICLECYTFINGDHSGARCQFCTWPLCEDCAKLTELKCHRAECDIFRSSNSKFYNTLDPLSICMQLDCITPLRVLLAKEDNPDRWNNEIEQMEDHKKERQCEKSWIADTNNIVEYLLGRCKLNSRGIDSEIIHKVIGILEINAFEAKTSEGHEIRCLFPKLAICSHSCVSNTTHAIHPSNGYKMQCRATIPILKGTQLYTCYTYTLDSTAERQKFLSAAKYFKCQCERCLDPTELGTHFSTLKCSQCRNGNVISCDPIESTADWKCMSCSSKINAIEVLKIMGTVKQEDTTILTSKDTICKKMEQYESFLVKLKNILHPNHQIFMSIKTIMIDLIQVDVRRTENSKFGRIYELCRNVLDVLNIIAPGKSRARGKILLIIQHSINTLAQKDNNFNLENATDMLYEAIEIMSWEELKGNSISSSIIETLSTNIKSCE
ncbi:unnamed protein product [Diamesa serratosioi]